MSVRLAGEQSAMAKATARSAHYGVVHGPLHSTLNYQLPRH
jgi:hypothetical protein